MGEARDSGPEAQEVEVEEIPRNIATRIGGPNGPKPGRQRGSKDKAPRNLKDFPRHIVEIVSIPLEVLVENQDHYREKLEALVQSNPVGFMVNVIIPMTKVLPSAVVAALLGQIGQESDTGPRAQLSAINMLLEAAERGEVDLEQLERAIEERAVHSVEKKH